jgi:hypothetical protein
MINTKSARIMINAKVYENYEQHENWNMEIPRDQFENSEDYDLSWKFTICTRISIKLVGRVNDSLLYEWTHGGNHLTSDHRGKEALAVTSGSSLLNAGHHAEIWDQVNTRASRLTSKYAYEGFDEHEILQELWATRKLDEVNDFPTSMSNVYEI